MHIDQLLSMNIPSDGETTSLDSPAASAVDKWEVQLRKGCLELAVLGCLWSGRLYGLEILRRLETGSGLTLSAGTVYPLLARLKSDGLLESEWVEADTSHPRKYYHLTALGKRRAVQMARMWSQFSATLKSLLSPVLKEGTK
ncbi:MAG TPA: PadR family transcriptional regulator [Terriglobia bacterium]|nr:PadR family transcriptional regulator [Terriglobia bacterium]